MAARKNASAIALWLLLCGLGSAGMVHYQLAPGDAGSPPASWPSDTGLKRAPGRPTLLVFVHPKCPCSRATVDSLAWVMSRAGSGVAAYAVFVRPKGFAEGWEQTDLWRDASRIPGVALVSDADGIETRRFGAETSGEAELFDAAGKLSYSGGLTAGRGHFGDNDGRDSVLSLVSGRAASASRPVYGCALIKGRDHG